MKRKTLLAAGAVTAGLAVAIGAFGAHALKDLLTEHGKTDVFDTAVQYQFFHAFALLLSGILPVFRSSSEKYARVAGTAFMIGIILFSGSLYVLCITNCPLWGAVTPFGGLSFILGWILLTIGILKSE